MKTTTSGFVSVFLVISGMALLVGNARALSMFERENVQTLSWTIEFVTFSTAMAIGLFVLRVSKRDSKNKKSKKDDS